MCNTLCLSFILFISIFFTYFLAEPFDPPQNVTIANVTASSITLLWHPPTEPNGIIVHYTVYYWDNTTVTEKVELNTDKMQIQNTLLCFCFVSCF